MTWLDYGVIGVLTLSIAWGADHLALSLPRAEIQRGVVMIIPKPSRLV